MQRTLAIDGEIIYCYDDGSVEWLLKANNQYGHKLYRSFGWLDNRGYRRVLINQKKYQIHRLIALAFCDNPNHKPYIDHINRNKSDNRIENLRWVTSKENNRNRTIVDNSKCRYGIRYCENANAYSNARKKFKRRNKMNEVLTYSFPAALESIKLGKKFKRLNWNSPNQWVAVQYPDEHSKMQCPYLYLKNAQDNLVPWFPSTGDLFAEDWVEVKEDTDQLSLNL